MFERLDELELELENIERQLSEPEIASNPTRLQLLLRRHGELSGMVDDYRRYKQLVRRIDETQRLMEEEKEEDLAELAREELTKLRGEREQVERKLAKRLLPKDPNEGKDVIMEIRAGTGGEEAALFARDLCRMYARYADRQGWKLEIWSAHPTAMGGFKEVILHISGKEAYRKLKQESGVHRVQRVPVTESSGRIHTSAATVAVLPEAEEVEVQIREEDLRIDTFIASAPGGQNVQKNETGVRIRHLPSGLVVECQDERSQLQNKQKALRILRTRLLERERNRQEAELTKQRKAQIQTGDRSEKSRTYNFPQNRITDHRLKLTLYNLIGVLEGELDELAEAWQRHELEQLMSQTESERKQKKQKTKTKTNG